MLTSRDGTDSLVGDVLQACDETSAGPLLAPSLATAVASDVPAGLSAFPRSVTSREHTARPESPLGDEDCRRGTKRDGAASLHLPGGAKRKAGDDGGAAGRDTASTKLLRVEYQEDSGWQCRRCTYENEDLGFGGACAMCGAPKPLPATRQQLTEPCPVCGTKFKSLEKLEQHASSCHAFAARSGPASAVKTRRRTPSTVTVTTVSTATALAASGSVLAASSVQDENHQRFEDQHEAPSVDPSRHVAEPSGLEANSDAGKQLDVNGDHQPEQHHKKAAGKDPALATVVEDEPTAPCRYLSVWLAPATGSELETYFAKLFEQVTGDVTAGAGANPALQTAAHVSVTGHFRASVHDIEALWQLLLGCVHSSPPTPPTVVNLVETGGLTAMQLDCPSGADVARAFKLAVAMEGLKAEGRYIIMRPKSKLSNVLLLTTACHTHTSPR